MSGKGREMYQSGDDSSKRPLNQMNGGEEVTAASPDQGPPRPDHDPTNFAESLSRRCSAVAEYKGCGPLARQDGSARLANATSPCDGQTVKDNRSAHERARVKRPIRRPPR